MPPGIQKYAGLPDDEDAAPEIYETPELADDVSTAQTVTQRSNSLASSEELDIGRHDSDTGIDRHRINRDEARRRFESSRVDATGVNFSDRLATGRKSYVISSRPRRRRYTGGNGDSDLSDSEDESLERRLARLKREAEEVRLEVQRREQEREEGDEMQEMQEMQGGVEELSRMLNGLYIPSRGVGTSAEATLSKKLASDLKPRSPHQLAPPEPNETSTRRSTLTSLVGLSDRLTALETSLGLSTTTPTSSTPILPVLKSLTSQLNTLTTTLSPPPSTSSSTTTTSTINIDTLQTRIRDLITQSDRLTTSRKAATQAATDLRQARLKAATTASATASSFPPSSTQSHPYLTPSQRPSNHHNAVAGQQQQQETLSDLLGYEDQSTKITALYATLPRIQELSPLLPVVLERLRSLQGIHAGAAQARGDLEDLERVATEMGEEIGEWRKAVERCEEKLRLGEEVVRRNGEVVGGLVRGVEGRLRVLEGSMKGP